MAKQKQIEPLVGKQLIHKVKELGNLSKSELAKICGYYSVTKNGLERVNMIPFLNALIDAEGIDLDGTSRDNGHEERSASVQIPVRANGSMDSNRIIRVKRAENPIVKPQPLSQRVQQQEVQQPQIEQPEQPEQVGHLESVAESTIEESVYGSGWSLAQSNERIQREITGGWWSSLVGTHPVSAHSVISPASPRWGQGYPANHRS